MNNFTTAHRTHNEEAALKTKFVVLWVLVGVPLTWGVMKTLQNALKLFN